MTNRNFDEWLNKFRPSISGYDYYIDFEKVVKNVDEIKVELNILNTLIGSKNIEDDFEKIVTKYPETLKCIPLLLAVRGNEIYAQDEDGAFLYDFKTMNYNVEQYKVFMRKTGLFDMITNHIVNNLVDYALGIETGLDSNGRKNRGGHQMEDLVEKYIVAAGFKKNENYFNFYVNGTFISATEPFVLTKSGEVKLIQCYTKNHVDMRLVRKYPKFTRISSFRKGLLGSKIEVSDDREFSSGRTLITIDELGNEDIFDSTVTVNRPYRYERFVFDEQKEGNLAEIEFYGKKRGTNVEVLLTGGFSGEPIKQTKTNWTMALDRSFDTYFKKNKGEKGNICLDLGKDNSYEITRVRYVPQTDSNFIVPGNQYRLEYWDNSSWKFFGEQIATDFSLNFSNVPTGRLYILHNLTNGVEERIFTYEDGKQVWW